jgi:hypothetical protein
MRLVKVLGVALVAVFAFSAMAAAGASAHTFTASAVGLLLLAEQEGTQVFGTTAGTLKCATVKGDGKSTALKSLAQSITVSYSGCKATNGTVEATPTQPIVAEYEFDADGSVKILSPVTIFTEFAGSKCTIKVPAQGPLKTVVFKSVGGTVLVESNVTGIESIATGSGCKAGSNGVTAKTGTYVGNAVTKADGGTVGWE